MLSFNTSAFRNTSLYLTLSPYFRSALAIIVPVALFLFVIVILTGCGQSGVSPSDCGRLATRVEATKFCLESQACTVTVDDLTAAARAARIVERECATP